MTTTTIEHAVRRAIGYMHVNLGQDLTIDDMARTAMFSKFHFTRIFRDVTGTSPGRFLSALRIQEAKRLLVLTDFSVADISSQVGYCSVGTFSSRFKACVGLSPSAYRQLGGVLPKAQAVAGRPASVVRSLSLRGRVVLPPGEEPGAVFVGLFTSGVRQGWPVRWTMLDGPGSFELRDVPDGTWHILAHSVAPDHDSAADSGSTGVLSVGRHGPVTVHPNALPRPVEIELRPQDLLDPPVLLARFGGEGAGARRAAGGA
ncbi:AraC family transcriptional regulator [Streptomyces sp. NBC_00249]|uniref:helix-turn-helix domain-containing protein n=1 Tax=Streptomyces sp. NBC_00249 TaxID=2975690 RepID=UPI0022576803|nr:AraC family transcriptional regulator [Streptomyces sp. NBC_00249]MCX5199546.1 AraC family transcriptional regulator [Streptomyces sp. NBC_00249]